MNPFKPFPKQQILDSSRLKEFADDNLNLMKVAESSPNLVENTVGKEEIARYEQFLRFPQCFLKNCAADTLKPRLFFGKGLKNA